MANIKENNSRAKDQNDTKGFRRAFVWGMAIHNATDIFAHSSYIGSNRIKHEYNYSVLMYDADNPNYYRERNDDAHTIARQMMAKYIGKDPLDATDLILPEAPSDYNLPHFYWYMVPMTGAQVAIKCFSYGFTTK